MNAQNSVFKRILAGDPQIRITRWHDQKGQFVGWAKMFLHGPRAFGSALLRLVFGYRCELPWISYSAMRTLDKYLNRQSRVLEYGSGMSTLWYAQRAGHVFSVEHDRQWCEGVGDRIKKRGFDHVELLLGDNQKKYVHLNKRSLGKFDLVVIDGIHRGECARACLGLVKPGGIVYLDNSDRSSSAAGRDSHKAEKVLREFTKKKGGSVRQFVDFVPGHFFVVEGLMFQMPGGSQGL